MKVSSGIFPQSNFSFGKARRVNIELMAIPVLTAVLLILNLCSLSSSHTQSLLILSIQSAYSQRSAPAAPAGQH